MSTQRQLVRLSTVQPAAGPAWLWPYRIPLGAVTLLEGDPGCGKSGIAYDLIARLTRGRPLPGSQVEEAASGVVLLEAEDGLAGTILPTLKAAGADLDRVYAYDKSPFRDQPLLLPADLPLLANAVAAVQARLLIVNPLADFLQAGLNSEHLVRRALGALAAFAEEYQIAILIVQHLTKGWSHNPLYRGAGSIAIMGAVRSALRVIDDPTGSDPARRVLTQVKIRPALAPSLAFRLPPGAQRRIEWIGECACTAQDTVEVGRIDTSALIDAMWVLWTLLRAGPLPAREVRRLATQADVANRTLDRAKKEMGIVTRKVGNGPGCHWYWELPEDERLLRPAIERDRVERMRRVRSEVAKLQIGAPWPTPDEDEELYQAALRERGLAPVRIGSLTRLLRWGDTDRAPLLEQLGRDASEGDVTAESALRDLLGELGVHPDQAAGWLV
jgi:hypothetical protein